MYTEKINKAVDQIIKDTKTNILKSISQDYNISYNELYNKYISKKTEYIELYEYLYDKKIYYIDNDDNIYSYNSKGPKLLGKKLVDGTIQFIKSQ